MRFICNVLIGEGNIAVEVDITTSLNINTMINIQETETSYNSH